MPDDGPLMWPRRIGVVRLACPCGRNLADVRLSCEQPWGEPFESMPHPEPEPVFPVPRPGVRQAEHHHGGGHFTFRWDCRCGRTWEARRDRLEAIWREHATSGTVRLILGHDTM